MVWLFDFSAPTFIILLLFLTFYFLRPVFITRSNKMFLVLVIFEVLGCISTYTSSYIDNHNIEYNQWFLTFINNAYYTMYVLRYFLFSLYIASLFHIKRNDPILITSFIWILLMFIVIAINPLTKWIYDVTPLRMFSLGPLIYLIYASNIFTLIFDVYYFARYFKKTDIKEKITIFFTIATLFACCITDIFYMDYIISDLFFILAISVLYLHFENPDLFREAKTDIFNVHAFKCAMNDDLYINKDYDVFFFIIKNYQEVKITYGTKQVDLLLKEIGDYLLIEHSNVNFFYADNGKFMVLDKTKGTNSKVQKKIEKRFKQSWTVENGNNILLNVLILNLAKDVVFHSYDELELSCDQALNEINNLTTNHITIDASIFNKVVRCSNVSKALNKALDNDSLLVYLQPIVEAKSNKIVAAEALVRLNDEDMGVIPPDEFILMAEQNGAIQRLGSQVLNKVCKFLQNTDLKHYKLEWINVNLSPIQCLDEHLLANVDSILDSNKIDHKYIHLEITEDCMINKDILHSQMTKLINSGYKLSLDDFGSGFSNLSLIKALPFSNIKLDMSIVRGHFSSPDNMMPGLVGIFRNRGLSVTSEGVETKEMAEMLTSMGCNYLQGYYFSKPLPMDEFLKLVESKL